MARVTVEDCLSNVDNVFQLVVIASKRARQIYNGAEPKVPAQGDKPTVLALREVAAGMVKRDILLEEKPEQALFIETSAVAEAEFIFDDKHAI